MSANKSKSRLRDSKVEPLHYKHRVTVARRHRSTLTYPVHTLGSHKEWKGFGETAPPKSIRLSLTYRTRESLVRCVSSMISMSESVNSVHQECWNAPGHTGLSLPVMAWKPRKRRGSGACREKASQDETLSYLDVSVSRIW